MKKTILSALCILLSLSVSAQGKSPFYDKGYAGNVELGCLVKSYPYATLSTTHGYCFGRGWFVGLGGAFESGVYGRNMENPDAEKLPYEGDMMVKLFLDLRKTFVVKSTGIFVDCKIGSPRDLAESSQGDWGEFVRPSVGIVFGRHFALSAGVDWSRLNYSNGKNAGCIPYSPRTITLPYVGFAYQF